MTIKPEDPEWIQEKMFGEEFDSPIIYYVVDIADDFVFYSGSLENCNQVLDENYGGLTITSYDQLTPGMRNSMPQTF
jgi:hypothetical protein